MLRRFVVTLALTFVIMLSVGIAPVLAEKQYTQSQQAPAQVDQKPSEEQYTQSQQAPAQVDQKPSGKQYTQSQQAPAQIDQKPSGKQYTQSQQTPVEGNKYTKTLQNPDSESKG